MSDKLAYLIYFSILKSFHIKVFCFSIYILQYNNLHKKNTQGQRTTKTKKNRISHKNQFTKLFFIELQIIKLNINIKYNPSNAVIMQLSSPKNQKKAPTVFIYQSYVQAQDQVQYICQLLILMLHKRRLDPPVICMNQLNDILLELQIPLKIKQLHQLFLYATYQKFQSKAQAKQRLVALMNNEKKKTDIKSVAKWLHQNIKKANIKFARLRATSQIKVTSSLSNQQSKRTQITKQKKWRLPAIKGSSSQKLTEQLKYLVQIFEQMEKQRQNSGLIPINLQSEDQELDLSTTNIPYDPQLYELNKNLAKLRIKAEDRLARIIQLARDQPRIRAKLQEAIEKFQKVRIEANQKVGRLGSMKAQKRLIENRKKHQDKLKNLRLGEQQDLLRAAKLFSLLSIQQRKSNKFIL